MGMDDLAEALARLGGLKPDIEADGGLKVLMAEHPAHELVVLGGSQDQGRGRMAVLVSRNPDADPVLDGVGDLVAERRERLVATVLAREEPERARAAQEHRPMIVHILLDELGQALLEDELELDPVLDIVVREDEPVG